MAEICGQFSKSVEILVFLSLMELIDFLFRISNLPKSVQLRFAVMSKNVQMISNLKSSHTKKNDFIIHSSIQNYQNISKYRDSEEFQLQNQKLNSDVFQLHVNYINS